INSSRFWWDISCRALAVLSASSSDFDASSEDREFSRKRTLFGLIWFPRNTGYTFSGASQCRYSSPIAAEICAKKDDGDFCAGRNVACLGRHWENEAPDRLKGNVDAKGPGRKQRRRH